LDSVHFLLKHRFKENLLWVKVRLQNENLIFILDSGCTDDALDSDTAKRLNVRIGGSERLVRRADRIEERNLTSALPMEINDVSFQNVKFVVLPLNQSTPDRRRIDGILGAPLFEKFLVQIDYLNLKIKLFSRTSPPDLDEAMEVKLHSHNDLMGIKLADKQGNKGAFVVDTGSSHGVIVSPHATENFIAIEGGTPRTLYAGGEIQARCCSETCWKIDSFHVSDLETLYCQPPGRGLLAAPQWSGIIGNGFLSKFTITFDSAGKKIFLEPTRSTNKRFAMR
jgi:hypothetical protein